MKSKMLGGILLIAGTSIGGGMLGLPIATAKSGIVHSSLLFVICWILMTFTALLTLEVNICFPKQSNVISMARATLGKGGAFICWTVYLLFSLRISLGLHSRWARCLTWIFKFSRHSPTYLVLWISFCFSFWIGCECRDQTG